MNTIVQPLTSISDTNGLLKCITNLVTTTRGKSKDARGAINDVDVRSCKLLLSVYKVRLGEVAQATINLLHKHHDDDDRRAHGGTNSSGELYALISADEIVNTTAEALGALASLHYQEEVANWRARQLQNREAKVKQLEDLEDMLGMVLKHIKYHEEKLVKLHEEWEELQQFQEAGIQAAD